MGFETVPIEVVWETTFANTSEEMSNPLVVLGLAAFVLLVGGFFGVTELRGPLAKLRRYFTMQSFRPGSNDDGAPVAVRGHIRKADETVSGPLSDEECVAYGHKEQTYQFGYKYDREKRQKMRRMSTVDDERANERTWSWNDGSTDVDHVPFHVETDHGPVAVDPDGADLNLPVQVDDKTSILGRIAYVVHPFTGNTIPLAGLFRRLPGADYVTPSRPEREVERHVAPGDEVLVIGDASGSAGSNLAGTVDGGGDVYRITTRSPLSLKFRSVLSVLGSSVVMLATLGFATVILYLGWTAGAF